MSTTIDQQFVEFVVKSLVSKPDEVKIERRIDEKGVLLELTVDPEDLGRVIGKRGATAQSLRTLLRALGTKNDARYNLKIVDNGEPRPERTERQEENTPYESKTDDSSSTPPPAQADEEDVAHEDMLEAEGGQEEPKTSSVEDAEVDHSDVVSQTRKELEELDDLDV